MSRTSLQRRRSRRRLYGVGGRKAKSYANAWGPRPKGAPTPGDLGSVLFDFDPSYSLSSDRAGGIELAQGGTGAVGLEVHNGHLCAVFSGANYLLGASSPFAALSEAVGGVSIYVVWERTDASAAGSAGLFSLDEAANATAQRNALAMYHVSANDLLVGASGDAGGTEYDTPTVPVARNIVQLNSLHATTSVLGTRLGGYLEGATTVASAPHDPASMDRCVIGASGLFGGDDAVSAFLTGRIYRVLICEGAFDQSFADYLAQLYTPRRLPPGIDPADIAFLWDGKHSPYRDTLNGIDLTPASAPVLASRAGDVGMLFDGVDDELRGSLDEFAMSGDWVMHLVGEPISTVGYAFGVEDTGNHIVSHARVGHYINAVGAVAARREASTEKSDVSGTASVAGKIELVTGVFTATTIEALSNGAGNGSQADTKQPGGINAVTLGSAIGSTAWSNSYVYWAMLVRAARSAAVEAWIAANFPVGVSP